MESSVPQSGTSGVEKEVVLSGVWIRPSQAKMEFARALDSIPSSRTIIGDFNCRHVDWCVAQNNYGTWLRGWAEENGVRVIKPDRPTFQVLSAIALCLTKENVRIQYHDIGLQHSAMLLQTVVQAPADLARWRPAWPRVDMAALDNELNCRGEKSNSSLWDRLTSVMSRLPWSRQSERQFNFWNPELEGLWKDTK